MQERIIQKQELLKERENSALQVSENENIEVPEKEGDSVEQ